MARDLTKGSPAKMIFLFAMPMLFGNIFQQLYNIVDSIVVGNYVGSNALAAVGASFPVMFILNAVAMGATMGASILISQLFGANRIKDMHRAIYTMLVAMAGLAIVLTAVGMVIITPMLKLLQTPDYIIADSASYLRIVFAGTIFTFAYNGFSALFRAVGDSKTPLLFLIISSIVNVVLDLVFVINFNMGVAGVAYATIIAQAVSAILCFIYIIKYVPIMQITKEDRVFDKEQLKIILNLGIPTAIQQITVSVSIMCVQGLVNSFGGDVMAGYSAGSRIESLMMMPMFNISMALSTFTAQNIGAGNIKRAKQGLYSTIGFSFVLLGVISLLTYIFRFDLIGLFVKDDVGIEVFNFGGGYLAVVAGFYIINALYNNIASSLRGAGDVKIVMFTTMIALLARVTSSYALLATTNLGYAAIWWGLPISWTVGLIISTFRFLSNGWTKSIVIKNQQKQIEIDNLKASEETI